MRRTVTSSVTLGTSAATSPSAPQTATYSRLALAAGHGRDWMARVIGEPVGHHRVQADLSAVALSHGVGGDQAGRAVPLQKRGVRFIKKIINF